MVAAPAGRLCDRLGWLIAAGGFRIDLRASRLSLRSEPDAGAVETIRNGDVADMGETRHPPGRLLDDDDRRVQSGPHLPSGVGVPRRAREKVERLRQRPASGWPRETRARRTGRSSRPSRARSCSRRRSRACARAPVLLGAGYRPTDSPAKGRGNSPAKGRGRFAQNSRCSPSQPFMNEFGPRGRSRSTNRRQ